MAGNKSEPVIGQTYTKFIVDGNWILDPDIIHFGNKFQSNRQFSIVGRKILKWDIM